LVVPVVLVVLVALLVELLVSVEFSRPEGGAEPEPEPEPDPLEPEPELPLELLDDDEEPLSQPDAISELASLDNHYVHASQPSEDCFTCSKFFTGICFELTELTMEIPSRTSVAILSFICDYTCDCFY
jgi:hypothetical protein